MTTDTIHSYYASPLADPEVYQAVYRRELQSPRVTMTGKGKKKRAIIKTGWADKRNSGTCVRCRSNPTGLPMASYCFACLEHIGKVWRSYGRIKYGHNKLGGLTAPLPPKVTM